MPRLIAFVLSFLLASQVLAGAPLAEIKFDNVKIAKAQRKDLNLAWMRFLKANNEILLGKNKDGSKAKFRVDQSCEFNFELTNGDALNLDSLTLIKHKNNFDYNLKAIEFLREQNLKLKKKKADEVASIKLVYWAF